MGIIQTFNLSSAQWLCLIVAAILIGFSKAGISGATIPVVPIIASIFGGKESTGIMLPMLIIADAFAICYYNKHGKWEDIKKLLPWALIGLIIGAIVGNYVNDNQFKTFIAISVFICLIILIYTERKGGNLNIPKGIWFYALVGMASGFTSMIGNAAGPLFSVYLLAMSFKKNDFVGTTAWFFFTINLSKLPVQIFFWNNIHIKTVLVAITMIPVIALGALFGVMVVKKLNEKSFRYVVICMTLISAIKLM